MGQVYAVVHNGKGEFFIARKNLKGYFFHDPKNPGQGTLLPNGKTLNGAGEIALPGGRLETNEINWENVVNGAIKEMLEETTIDLNPETADPGFYNGTDGDNKYYAAYFRLGADFNAVLATVRLKLGNADRAATVVRNRTWTGNYPSLIADYACPMDNELESFSCWNLVENWKSICDLLLNPATSWYYYILKHLRDTFFPIRVTDARGALVGIGLAVAEIPGPEYVVDTLAYNPITLQGDGVYTVATSTENFLNLKFTPGIASGSAGTFRPAD